MTNRRDYSFDFATEVNDLRASLGAKADNILFALLPAPSQPVMFDDFIGEEKSKQRFGRAERADVCESVSAASSKRNDSFTMTWDCDDGGSYVHFISLRESESFTQMWGEEIEPLLRLFVLYHETAHALHPHEEKRTPLFEECMADAYAALRLFQRFGEEAKGLLSMVSLSRLACPPDYLTTTVLNKIIEDSAGLDFANPDQDKIIALAADYAEKGTLIRPQSCKMNQRRPSPKL